MKKAKTLIFLFFLFALAGCSQQVKEPAEKTTHIISGMWVRYNLEEAVEKAATIVHGVINTKSDTKYYDVETPEGEKISKIYYREVEIQVLDCLKGDPDAETVIYEEEGGETEDAVYICTDIHEVQEGEEILIFLNETNKLISPSLLFTVDENKQIQVGKYVFPFETEAQEMEAKEKPYYTTEMPLEDYCAAIQTCLEETEASSLSEGKEGIVLTISKIEEEENGYWIEYFVENKTEEPVSYAQDWKIECWQEGAWKQVAEAEEWEDCLYSASAQGMDKQQFYLKKDVEFSPDKIYRLVKKLYFLEEGEKDWMAGEFQFP